MLKQKYWLTRVPCRRLFGFLLGSTLAGASVYYYILEEYKVSNEMLTEDIYVGPLSSQPLCPLVQLVPHMSNPQVPLSLENDIRLGKMSLDTS
jgi:hypothetical protein